MQLNAIVNWTILPSNKNHRFQSVTISPTVYRHSRTRLCSPGWRGV